ncbi:MAG: alpha-amylase [Candidatus Marinimicrobia bacterium]|nr:alpha-amylase [Candidatus Neomarinimicrobiota bacterium]
MNNWIDKAIFYHIYPLGFCGAPSKNNFQSKPIERLYKVTDWIGHMKKLSINALYLGPVFESVEHGYDTVDYFQVDRRLGTNETLKSVIRELHENGIKIVLDGVFNHVGREFFAFKDLQQYREKSMFANWFAGLDFSGNNPFNDGFDYETWDGHYNLVKLNLKYFYVREYLLNAVKMWIEELDIDGLRLDAADVLDFDFMRELSTFTKSMKPDFWLMGEVVHGDYNRWANPEMLDSVTNYECYKGLYSSCNDRNMFEIAYALKRQSGVSGIYENLKLYNFLDNHDVNRIATSLANSAHQFPLQILLFSMPGIPSIYYGSEWGIEGKKGGYNDLHVRPNTDLEFLHRENGGSLVDIISRLAGIRKESEALNFGDYQEICVESEFLAFSRQYNGKKIIVMINISEQGRQFHLNHSGNFVDVLNINERVRNDFLVPANWGRILEVV